MSSIIFISFSLFSGSCNEFLTKNVAFGGTVSSSTGSSSSSTSSSGSSGGVAPADDDADGLSNELENAIGSDPTTADSDHDGFADGLEYVGRSGDPLNSRLSPSPFNRVRILTDSELIVNDPDSDGDGLGNLVEQRNGLDPNNPDSDEDGYQDGLEIAAGSDPLDASSRPVRTEAPISDGTPSTEVPLDSDGDGLADEIENLRGSNPVAKDTDGDGYSDGIEFLFGSDPQDNHSVPNFTLSTADE
jgi:hypothetical protein